MNVWGVALRPKYGLKDNTALPPSGKKSVEIAAMPLLTIYKGIPGPTLLAEILLQKYVYHLPFYRQVQQLRHLGFKASESTIDGWCSSITTMVTTIITSMAAYSNERVAAIVISVLYRMLTYYSFLCFGSSSLMTSAWHK